MRIGPLKKQLKIWQKELGLRDWKIEVAFAKKKDFEEGRMQRDCLGNTFWVAEHKEASIYLHRIHETEDEAKETLFHEILHCLCEGSRERPLKYDTQYENALNRISAYVMKLENAQK